MWLSDPKARIKAFGEHFDSELLKGYAAVDQSKVKCYSSVSIIKEVLTFVNHLIFIFSLCFHQPQNGIYLNFSFFSLMSTF